MCTFPSEELFFSLISQMDSEKQQHCCERWAGQREMTFPFGNSHYISFAASQNYALWLFLVLDCLNFLESE